jgi:peptidoglycan/xylan/chitin deacetylase (PgdA/CDA1 family)
MKARASLIILALLSTLSTVIASEPSPKPAPAGATILCYHIVESPRDPRMEISRDTFRQQMRYLASTGYNVIPLSDLYAYLSGKKASLPKNAVVVTVDDGWRSTYTELYPEMKKRSFPFTVFIYPKIIGQTAYALTWGQIREMARNGVDVQSHAFSHPFLTRRRHAALAEKDYEQFLTAELTNSKKTIEQEIGRPVTFIAYPYGDYDKRVAEFVAKSGYQGALTCDFGRVSRGCDPLRMKRVVIDKKMDFATFRRYLGANALKLEETTPQPGQLVEIDQPIFSARIPDFQSLDPRSVGMALLTGGGSAPFAYDPKDGTISVTTSEPLKEGMSHRAIVWGTDRKSGRRVEATWTFRTPPPMLPAPVIPNIPIAPALAAVSPKCGPNEPNCLAVGPVVVPPGGADAHIPTPGSLLPATVSKDQKGGIAAAVGTRTPKK